MTRRAPREVDRPAMRNGTPSPRRRRRHWITSILAASEDASSSKKSTHMNLPDGKGETEHFLPRVPTPVE